MRTLIIRSSEWLRGRTQSRLYDVNTDKACCLGLDLIQRGIRKEKIPFACGDPANLLRFVGKIEDASNATILLGYFQDWTDPKSVSDLYHQQFLLTDRTDITTVTNKDFARSAMTINDDLNSSDEEKIEALRPIFAKVGIEIDWRPNE